jgi:hypothetical protein
MYKLHLVSPARSSKAWISKLDKADAKRWLAITEAEQREWPTIEAAQAAIGKLCLAGVNPMPDEKWTINAIVSIGIKQQEDQYYWTPDNGYTWQRIPEYLYTALNRFGDEAAKAEAEP